MQLIGEISTDRPLLVLAVKEEAAHLDGTLPVLLTGMGKVNAATALATALARGPKPSSIVNLGTAGALTAGWAGSTQEIAVVIQHDLDTDLLHTLTGDTFGGPIKLAGSGTGPTLATGDTFVSESAARERLAARADLVDMEGYALASVAEQAGVPIRLVKHVSDEADEGAARSWRESVDNCARVLAAWARTNLA
ncbi:nucleosidase [Streptoverticillium reticulum]|uniref:nucleosidase n=1 Tax=Streptoverticillium reticulum TaxID=1433415 RepID=UPI0039BFAF04